VIIKSNLLSGGIVNKFLSVLSKASLYDIHSLAQIANDKSLEIASENKSDIENDRDLQIFSAIIK
jgi:hypothetical protein